MIICFMLMMITNLSGLNNNYFMNQNRIELHRKLMKKFDNKNLLLAGVILVIVVVITYFGIH